jgi:hypothetical protein
MSPPEQNTLIREKESSTPVESRTLRFRQLQSTVEYVKELVCKLFTRPSCFLKLEVKSSADGWALVLSFELR